MLFSLLLTALLPLASVPVSAAPTPALAKRQSFGGRATFYDVGLGACGGYNVASDFIVALNAPQYGGGYPGPQCGKTITISHGGKTAQATIRDLCPGCGFGDLDMSRGLFTFFESESAGVFQMNWWFNDGSSQPQPQPEPEPSPEPEPTSTWTPPPTSTWTPTPETSSSTWTPEPSTAPSSSSSDSDSSASASASSSASLEMPNVVINGTTISAPLPSAPSESMGNIALLNLAITNFGAVIVAGASTS